MATVEAGSLQSSPDERLQLTVAQWDTGDSGTDRQTDIRDIGLTYQVSAASRVANLSAACRTLVHIIVARTQERGWGER